MTAFSIGADGCGVAEFDRPAQLSGVSCHRRQGFVSPHGAIENDSCPEFEPENQPQPGIVLGLSRTVLRDAAFHARGVDPAHVCASAVAHQLAEKGSEPAAPPNAHRHREAALGSVNDLGRDASGRDPLENPLSVPSAEFVVVG